MSGTTLRMLISFSGILAVFWAAQHVAQKEEASFEMAQNKEQILLHQSHQFRHTEKVKGPLSTNISLVGAVTATPGQAFVLQGTVTSIKEVSHAKVRWILPAGVQLVSGSLEQTIDSVSPTHPFQSQITVEQKDHSNQQIHFVVSGDQPGIHFSSVAQYNTTDEDFLMEQKDLVLKTLRDQKREHKRASHIFH